MVAEIISPNVTHIIETPFSIGAFPNNVRIHPRGIIEIDTKPSDFIYGLWDLYEKAGAVYPVNVTGLTDVAEGNQLGSERFCTWSAWIARKLTKAINEVSVLELIRSDDRLLKFECVSKYFRFMRYKEGGEHYPHYDSDFAVYDSEKLVYVTKYSLVAYFNDCDSGEIAFIDHDGKDKSDWSRQATDDEIFLKIKPKAGKIVLFPHDVCHTVLPFTDKDRIRYVARGDLIFTEVP